MTTLLEQARYRQTERVKAVERAREEHRKMLKERLGAEALHLAHDTFGKRLAIRDLTFSTNDKGKLVTSFQVDEFTATVKLNGQSSLFELTARCPSCSASWTIGWFGPSDLERLDDALLNNYAEHEWHDPRCPNYNPNVPEGLRGVEY